MTIPAVQPYIAEIVPKVRPVLISSVVNGMWGWAWRRPAGVRRGT
ncbi:hypothetical protein OHB05_29440 [Streptomyces sp. NBC_00638]|nr:hypothetical protein [Streptomyces sp. NBC_00638]MCX5006713.1 hypothetical protein [Streptomyces sp. NBC_00638]